MTEVSKTHCIWGPSGPTSSGAPGTGSLHFSMAKRTQQVKRPSSPGHPVSHKVTAQFLSLISLLQLALPIFKNHRSQMEA